MCCRKDNGFHDFAPVCNIAAAAGAGAGAGARRAKGDRVNASQGESVVPAINPSGVSTQAGVVGPWVVIGNGVVTRGGNVGGGVIFQRGGGPSVGSTAVSTFSKFGISGRGLFGVGGNGGGGPAPSNGGGGGGKAIGGCAGIGIGVFPKFMAGISAALSPHLVPLVRP